MDPFTGEQRLDGQQQGEQQMADVTAASMPVLLQAPDRLITAIYWCDIPTYRTIGDRSTDAGSQFQSALKIGANSVNAPLYWGRTVENPDKVVIIVRRSLDGPDTHEAYLTGKQEPWRYAASKMLLKNCLAYPTIHHADLEEIPDKAFDAPITLIGAAFFGADETWEPARQNFVKVMKQYNSMTEEGTHGRQGAQDVFMGWATENDVSYACFDGPRKLGKAYYMLSGWPSVEAQQQFHVGEGMHDEAWGLITSGADGWRVMHVQFSRVDPDAASRP